MLRRSTRNIWIYLVMISKRNHLFIIWCKWLRLFPCLSKHSNMHTFWFFPFSPTEAKVTHIGCHAMIRKKINNCHRSRNVSRRVHRPTNNAIIVRHTYRHSSIITITIVITVAVAAMVVNRLAVLLSLPPLQAVSIVPRTFAMLPFRD